MTQYRVTENVIVKKERESKARILNDFKTEKNEKTFGVQDIFPSKLFIPFQYLNETFEDMYLSQYYILSIPN